MGGGGGLHERISFFIIIFLLKTGMDVMCEWMDGRIDGWRRECTRVIKVMGSMDGGGVDGWMGGWGW